MLKVTQPVYKQTFKPCDEHRWEYDKLREAYEAEEEERRTPEWYYWRLPAKQAFDSYPGDRLRDCTACRALTHRWTTLEAEREAETVVRRIDERRRREARRRREWGGCLMNMPQPKKIVPGGYQREHRDTFGAGAPCLACGASLRRGKHWCGA